MNEGVSHSNKPVLVLTDYYIMFFGFKARPRAQAFIFDNEAEAYPQRLQFLGGRIAALTSSTWVAGSRLSIHCTRVILPSSEVTAAENECRALRRECALCNVVKIVVIELVFAQVFFFFILGEVKIGSTMEPSSCRGGSLPEYRRSEDLPVVVAAVVSPEV
ncbi:hypothetical protein KQX54_021382 [Cotesia glomerata]|uniref:Uncharacterized protein n=1 Tax=Cotesia glomerata TaxID=32391 RepID=A0AAV7JA41_COTGL|nr:hypothetical protein KQX54_021382 [Cotesia glomerata]